mgnify:CR=1 FL=1
MQRGSHRAAGDPPAPGGDRDGLRDYLRAIADTPLLTREREIDLARRIERADDAARRLRAPAQAAEAGAVSPDPATRRALAACAEDGQLAAEEFARANLRLVVSVARRYVGRGLALPDLIQEGNVGLLAAVRKFGWRRGFRFSTYATWWIRQAIDRAIADGSRTVRLPVHMHDAVRRLRRRRADLRAALGRDPRPGELADALGTTEEGLAKIVAADRRMLSLDAPLAPGEGGAASLGDLLADADATPVAATEERLLADDVELALLCLDGREAHVLRRRFGLGGGTAATLGEVGAELGLSRERVRQIELVALDKLRTPTLRARLAAYAEAS